MKASFLKYFVLTIVLIIPVTIYLFLELFGKNKYEIPVFYQEPLTEELPNCSRFTTPHQVNLSGFPLLKKFKGEGQTYLLHLTLDECFDCTPNLNEIKRVLNKHKDLKVVSIYAHQVTLSNTSQPSANWEVYGVHFSDFLKIMRCQLVIDVPSQTSVDSMKINNRLVLVDRQGRIRGYYNKSDREDMDRLIVELSILKESSSS